MVSMYSHGPEGRDIGPKIFPGGGGGGGIFSVSQTTNSNYPLWPAMGVGGGGQELFILT